MHQLLYILLFSVSGGALLGLVISLIRNKTAVRVTVIGVLGFFVVLFGAHIVYFKIFGNYFDWAMADMMGEAMTNFAGMLMIGIGRSLFPILLLLLPVIGVAVFIKRLTYYPVKRVPMMIPLLMASVMMLGFLLPTLILTGDKSEGGDWEIYSYPNELETPNTYGILTATRLNLGRVIFGIGDGVALGPGDDDVTPPDDGIFGTQSDSEDKKDPPESSDGTDTSDPDDTTDTGTDEPEPPKVYGDNVLDIDFASLIANTSNKDIKAMHEYFSKLTPTKKNEYTGYFEGKNLIFLTLEGFSGKVISPELTPTLYMMATGGFVFNNYYCSNWGGSTATGEYANLTGNFYNSASCMKSLIAKTYQPFVLARQFKNLGYYTPAYHAWTHSYYNRDESHPSLGYDYLGFGNGLENLKDADGNGVKKQWVSSDHDTAKVTVSQYIDRQPFHVYYMTISGHANYNWGGNAMCKKHKSDINAFCEQYGLNYSDEVKAYLACQLEVELMAKELVDQLSAAGILDNTVFVMAADHYPYGLSDASIAELYGLPVSGVRQNFETYRNTLIIWSSSMEAPIPVNTPCSAVDILPTVSNLFGLAYDSRLMTGVDVFSGTDPIVYLNFDQGSSWNWINSYGSYNSGTKKFTVAEGVTVDESALAGYVKSMNSLVSTRRKYSLAILKNNYYAYVFPDQAQ